MPERAHRLTRPSGQALLLELRGHLTETAMLELQHDLRSRVQQAPEGSLRVVVDLCAVVDYSLEARDVLVRCLAHLEPKTSRLLYVAQLPGARALSLWICRMATPGKSQVVADAGRARRWLTPEQSGTHATVDTAPRPATRRPA